MRLVLLCILGAMCVAMVGCGSMEEYQEERRQELLTIYPPGRTSRDDVRKKWGEDWPRGFPHYYAATRPVEGWESFSKEYVRERVLRSQQRTGEAVASLERYYGPDGHHFLGLCYIWYYYGAADKLVDVEWQYASD